MTFVANTAAIDLNQYIKDPAKTNPNYTAADNRLSVDAVIHRYRTGMPSMIGVGMAFATPPPEPCGRFSRTRLSSWWFPHRDCLADCQAVCSVNNPAFAKTAFGQVL